MDDMNGFIINHIFSAKLQATHIFLKTNISTTVVSWSLQFQNVAKETSLNSMIHASSMPQLTVLWAIESVPSML